MTSILLSQSTQEKINLAVAAGPGPNNQNYLAAYNAISNDINVNGGVNPGTSYWFSLAGAINTQQFSASAPGTYIWNYTIAAAQAQGTTLTASDMQAASNRIAATVFDQLKESNFVLSDDASIRINFAPKTIIEVDAGSGLAELSALHPGSNLTTAIWGGTLFARTALNDPTYFSDNNIDLTPGSRDCAAITFGSVAAVNSVSLNPFLYPQGIQAIQFTDYAAIKACFPNQHGSLGSGTSTVTLDDNDNLIFRQTDGQATTTTAEVNPQGRITQIDTLNNNGTITRADFRPDGTSAVTGNSADPAAAYASFTDRYDAAQHLIEETVHKIDGSTTSSAVSTSGTQSWLNDALTYDQFGRLAAETLINRDNTTVTRVNDLAGTQSFATQISIYDQASRLTLQDTFNDDGSVVQQGFDPGNQNPNFEHFVTTFNSFLQRTSETDTYDDHGHADFLFDTTGQAWASQVSVYNPAGQVTRTEAAADDGSATVNIYDPAHIHPDYDHAVGHFDSQHRETDEIDTFDNGGRNELRWDTAGQQVWTEQVRQFDPSNRETVRDEFNDDHTTTQYGFDLTGAANWSSYVAHFDAQGHETNATYEFDVGPNAGGHADLRQRRRCARQAGGCRRAARIGFPVGVIGRAFALRPCSRAYAVLPQPPHCR
jgi:hypothetical protein